MGVFSENPVLAKEIRSRLRARKQSKGNRFAAYSVVGLVVFLLYFYGLRAMLTGDARSSSEFLYVFYTIGIELTLILFMVPSLASSAITQEREQQTWNALLLSRLTAGEIVMGKFIAALFPVLLVLAVFAPLTFMAAVLGAIDPVQYLLSNLLLLATLAFFTATSLYWSWFCRRTFVATSFAFATVMFFIVGTLLIWGLIVTASGGRSLGTNEFFLMWLNPYVAMTGLLDQQRPNESVGIVCIIVYLLTAALLLLLLIRRLPYGAKELEQ